MNENATAEYVASLERIVLVLLHQVKRGGPSNIDSPGIAPGYFEGDDLGVFLALAAEYAR